MQLDSVSTWVCRAQKQDPGPADSLEIKRVIRCGGQAPMLHSKHCLELLARLAARQPLNCSHFQEYSIHSQKQVTETFNCHICWKL